MQHQTTCAASNADYLPSTIRALMIVLCAAVLWTMPGRACAQQADARDFEIGYFADVDHEGQGYGDAGILRNGDIRPIRIAVVAISVRRAIYGDFWRKRHVDI